MNEKMPYAEVINSSEELITSREETRAGFIKFALEKNRRSTPFIEEAKAFRHEAMKAKAPKDLLLMKNIRAPLITAAGLSDKSLIHLTEEDKTKAISDLVINFLEPEGDRFVDEAVFRFLLIKGDSLGGSMRNIVGALAQQSLIRTLISVMSIRKIKYCWTEVKEGSWTCDVDQDAGIEETLKAIAWENEKGNRMLAFNLTIPLVKKNIDLCLFDVENKKHKAWLSTKSPEKVIMLGELKGGIDPAGADEHWKTGNSALERIRTAFGKENIPIKTAFLGAAIEASMATEIWAQLKSGKLSNAANITKENQLIEFCSWVLEL